MQKKFEVKIERLIIVNGGVYYSDKAPITDYRGAVAIRQMPLNDKMMMAVPEGTYLVQFTDQPPKEMIDNFSSWKMNKFNLMQSGASIEFNVEPFAALLTVRYASQFERGATILTISYNDGSDVEA